MSYKYYKGTFTSQFSLPKENEPNSKYSKGSKGKFFGLQIEDKKELRLAEEITEAEYLEALNCGSDPLSCGCIIHNNGNAFVLKFPANKEAGSENSKDKKSSKSEKKSGNDSYLELESSQLERPIRIKYNELALILDKNSSNFTFTPGDFYTAAAHHGKLSAPGYIRTGEYTPEDLIIIDDSNNPLPPPPSPSPLPPDSPDPIPPKPLKKVGCFSPNAGSFSNRMKLGLFGDAATGTSGLFGSGGKFFGINGANGSRSGCWGTPGMGGSVPGGCFGAPGMGGSVPGAGGGCFSLGWLWQLLKWLLALGLLLYLLSMLRNCDMTPQERVVYVHDTIQTIKYDTVNVIEEVKITSTDKISLPNVQFKTDSDELVEGSLPDIKSLAEFLVRNDSVTATIEGHTDDVGLEDHNLKLSQARADAVKRELIKMGIDSTRIQTVGYGETRPKAFKRGTNPPQPDTSEEGRLINRRVEVKLDNMGTTTTTETKETTQ